MGDDPSSVTGSVTVPNSARAGNDQTVPTGTTASSAPPGDEPELIEELLIEEISIDGMCGVY